VFKDRVVVVTGAGSGIGLASARAYGEAGARVHLVDRVQERLGPAREEVRSAGAPLARAHVLDCGDAEALEALAEEIYRQEGRVDLLQSGVGKLVAGPVEELSLAHWEEAIRVNLWSVIHGVRAFVPRMLKQPGGAHLVHIASFAGLVAFPYTLPYSTSKFAVVGLSEGLAAELGGRGIRVTTVCPGAVRTRLMEDGHLALPGAWNAVIKRTVGRVATPPEVVARRILRAVERGEELVIPTPSMWPMWWFKRSADRSFRQANRLLCSLLTRGRS